VVYVADIGTELLVAASGAGLPAQDYVRIAGMASPGKVTIIGLRRESAIDEREGYGLSGATSVPRGDKLARCTLHFEFWLDSQMTLGGPTPGSIGWNQYFLAWFSRVGAGIPGGALPMAVGISHPVLEQFGVTQWLIADRGGLEHDEFGLYWCDIHLKEYRKPLPAPQKPVAAIPAVSTTQPTAQDALDAQIEAASALGSSLGAALK
jgi:hypothetical protein